MVWKNHKNKSKRLGSPGNISKMLKKIVSKNYVSTGMVVDNCKEFQDLANSLEFECQTEMMSTMCLAAINKSSWVSLKQLLQSGL